jgi:predicted ArsR family transcriptional regulator
MDRKEFLRTCAGGLCACTTACVMPPAEAAAAEAAKSEDWRWPFVKQRYAHLLETLSNKMGEDELIEILHAQGSYCSSLGNWALEKYRGDVDGYSAFVRKTSSADIITYDREKGVITMTTDERAECFCPLNGAAYKTPGVVCNCSLGWQQHTWETILQKKVRVELKESVLRGGKRCTFEIHVLDEPV